MRSRRELVGTGPLAELLADPATTDVVVNGPDDVRVDRGRGWEVTPVRFADEAAVQRLARRLAAAAGRRLDDAQPFVDAQLADGTRLHAMLPPIAAGGTCLSLRVLRPAEFDLADAGPPGRLPARDRSAAARASSARGSPSWSPAAPEPARPRCWPPCSARSTHDERIITVEDAGELRPTPPARAATDRPDQQRRGRRRGSSLRDLVRQGLRMRPDRLVVGEVRGPEVVDLLIALNTGHRGGAGTVHANTAADVPARLAALAALGGMTDGALHAQLAGAVQVVVQLERLTSGGQVIRRVAEVGVVRRQPDGRVRVVSAYTHDGTRGPGAAALDDLLDTASA